MLNISAVIGGVIGGLTALGILVSVGLLFGISTAVTLRKQGMQQAYMHSV